MKERENDMPTYEYECKHCGHEFSAFLSLDERDKKKVRCPKCDSTDVKHVIESVFVTTSKKS
jgi:putative FmdB family regulatory protein